MLSFNFQLIVITDCNKITTVVYSAAVSALILVISNSCFPLMFALLMIEGRTGGRILSGS